ncbi:polyprenyl synthetase family protein [Zhihengliuella salsuginis]|uniref:Geranylgeranyl pyrophosphate synthase n=1 Tax=Zhihengliuella salsuginis TaxID=578222 RepID=A0ABQ3GD39_9MICC|nr:polyprenyl synthetase family protein [Zhihengliuella salsuginis]GHD00914.1 geranylgeranyl pyrophosphate synthase [Zhihengliuella salsuginis]
MTSGSSTQPAADDHRAVDVAAFTARVNGALASFLDEQRTIIGRISPHADELIASIHDLTLNGKRLRPRFAFLGFVGAGGVPEDEDIVRIGASLELFQAAALIHDDLIDRSDTRRGQPSVHRRFEALHRRAGWARDAARFGEAASVLAGDLCLSLSEQMFGTTSAPPAARRVFDTMRTQVMSGQFLDVLEESAGPSYGADDAVSRARTIVRYKSAKYSTENPMLLGGALAGASEDVLHQYSAFALPLGEAFQLRDDVLGVFGDPATTGKPAGDDLREGKRTELIAHALRLSPASDGDFIQNRLGADDLGDAEVSRMCTILVDCGALAATEDSISELSDQGFDALAHLHVPEPVREALRRLGLAAIRRTS